jgi:tetratricopeptide (TPR) repeat protein
VDERVAQYDPGNPKVFFDNAITFLWAGRNDKVQPALERALTLDPTYEAAAGMLAEFLIKERGDVEGARRLLRGRGPESQVILAWTYLLTREYDKAIRLIEELPADFSTTRGPTEWSKAELLGVFLDWAGHDQRARPLLEPARDRVIALLADETLDAPVVEGHLYRLAYFELALGNDDAAVQAAERLAQSSRRPINRLYDRGWLAEIYARAGRSDEAIALISEFLKSPSVFSSVSPHTLRLDPLWDAIRDDPRFQKLVASPAPK